MIERLVAREILAADFLRANQRVFSSLRGEQPMNIENHADQKAFIDSYQALKARVQAIAEGRPLPEPAITTRQRRALQTCHRYKAQELVLPSREKPSKAYVPELSARLEEDTNLTDGARRCGRKIAELTYRMAREDRALPLTVSYLAKGLRRCERTVQRYLRQLEAAGYIRTEIVTSGRSRMTFGLVINLLAPLMAAHHREKWPGALRNQGVTKESLNKRFILLGRPRISVEEWSRRCMDGVFRAFMQARGCGLSQRLRKPAARIYCSRSGPEGELLPSGRRGASPGVNAAEQRRPAKPRAGTESR